MRELRYAALCGTMASLASAASLMIASHLEGRSPWQPLNATSHWLWGDQAARIEDADLKHTGAGVVTHHASAMFWGSLFGVWLARQPRRGAAAMLRDASAAAALAAAVDYTLVPKRLRPGWELVLPPRSMTVAFAALALGLACGGLMAQSSASRG